MSFQDGFTVLEAEGRFIQTPPAKPSKQSEPLLTTLLFFMSHFGIRQRERRANVTQKLTAVWRLTVLEIFCQQPGLLVQCKLSCVFIAYLFLLKKKRMKMKSFLIFVFLFCDSALKGPAVWTLLNKSAPIRQTSAAELQDELDLSGWVHRCYTKTQFQLNIDWKSPIKW